MDEQERQQLASEVRAMRRGLGLSQNKLAERAGVAPRTVRNLESGKVKTQPGHLDQILRAVGYVKPIPRPWDDEVEAFLQILGYRLSRVSHEERENLIAAMTRLAIKQPDNQ